MVSPKSCVADLKPYINGAHSAELLKKSSKVMKLDSNESTMVTSPRVIGALTQFIQQSPLQWYPDVASTELIVQLAQYTGLPPEWIQTFNGSDHALETICRTYLGRGDEVILCMPTYDHFRVYAESCEATLIPVFSKNIFQSKTSEIIAAISEKTKIIYLVNPNNPTGMMYTEGEIRNILKSAPEALIIVDEAYFEFCGVTVISLLKEFSNLAITRSFSKAFGLASLRCGYTLTHPQNLESINKIRIGKNINSLAQVAACKALEDCDFMQSYVAEVTTAREWLVAKFFREGFCAVATRANYILLQVAQPQAVVNFLREKNIYIRDRSMLPQMEGFVRITIGHLHLMERFWKIFQQIPTSFLLTPSWDRKNVKIS